MEKLVIFDMDGTMLDTEPISLEAMIYAGKILGVEISRTVGESLMGKSLSRCRDILLGEYGETFNVEKAFELHKKYINDFIEKNGVPVKPGVYEIMDKLEALGIKKCVATSTGKESALRKLKIANLAHRFEVIVGGDEVENGKPSPDIFLKAAASCNTAPKDCIVIEDTEAGILGATSAGMRVIAVPDIAPLNKEIRAKAYTVCADLFKAAELFTTER